MDGFVTIRIVLGLLGVWESVQWIVGLYSWEILKIYSSNAVSLSTRSFFSLYHANSTLPFYFILWIVQLIFSVNVVIGFKTRRSSWILFFMICSWQSRIPVCMNMGDTLFRVLLFFGSFSGWESSFSIDSYEKKSSNYTFKLSHIIARYCFFIQVSIALIYHIISLLKTSSLTTINGILVLLNAFDNNDEFSIISNDNTLYWIYYCIITINCVSILLLWCRWSNKLIFIGISNLFLYFSIVGYIIPMYKYMCFIYSCSLLCFLKETETNTKTKTNINKETKSIRTDWETIILCIAIVCVLIHVGIGGYRVDIFSKTPVLSLDQEWNDIILNGNNGDIWKWNTDWSIKGVLTDNSTIEFLSNYPIGEQTEEIYSESKYLQKERHWQMLHLQMLTSFRKGGALSSDSQLIMYSWSNSLCTYWNKKQYNFELEDETCYIGLQYIQSLFIVQDVSNYPIRTKERSDAYTFWQYACTVESKPEVWPIYKINSE